ncbi:MAG: glycosyltransferase family 2 protein [Ruminococcaceae bacterium]|nr:glycosyltransferase family 2 protein [Oscillospiraceae bacterium]
MNDLVSIIMPSYNTAEYIKNSIESVLNQTYTNWELIIVDDCSTDSTDEVMACFNDERIRYIKNEKNSGAAVSRNRALREAKGKWIAFLDSDDLWEAEKLEKQIRFMKETGYKFTYTDYRIQLNGTWLPYVYTGPDKVNERKMKNYCYFSTITVMYDREYVGLIQIEPVKKNNDYAMWLKIIKKTPCYRYPVCLSSYIKHEGSISSGSKLKLIKHHYIMWRVAEKKNPISATVLTVRNLFWGTLKKLKYKELLKEGCENASGPSTD